MMKAGKDYPAGKEEIIKMHKVPLYYAIVQEKMKKITFIYFILKKVRK